jgi:hypothetical protein
MSEKNILQNLENFDWFTYIRLNPDLNKNITKTEAINHYKNYGIKENRKYHVDLPSNFNWKGYIYLNNDLNHIKTKSECINHYLQFGYFEKRKYEIELPDNFNWKNYLKINHDLKDKIKTKEKAIEHYLKKGFFEDRIYAKIIEPTKQLFALPPIIIENSSDYISDYNSDYISDYNNVDMYDGEDLFYDEIHENDILRTCQFNNFDINFLKNTIDESTLNKLDNFILVVDFNNGGGGTTFFLNTIISKYKKYQTFVIIRSINGFIHININEEYIIHSNYNVFQCIYFIETHKSRINKIFVNHLMYHHSYFIEKIFSLNKEVIGITHDYYNIVNTPQPFFHEIPSLISKNEHKIDINKYNHIITQNIENLYFLKKTFKNKISVVPLPDYLMEEKNKTYYHDKNNEKIVIGIIGNIVDIKGKQILKEIIEFYRNNKNIEFFVIGYTEIKNFINFECYNTIEEFNNIIFKKKINMFLELSLWPETYCYTLTLAMTTKLPIIYLDKNFSSVVKNRLINYKNARSFNSMEELNTLIMRKKQNCFYKIKPIIYYSKFWNNLFITKTQKQELVKNISFKNHVKPYFIYFPQFHNIEENNILFYQGFNDMINLQKYNNENDVKIEELDNDYLGLKNMVDYDLIDENIIQKQIQMIDDYGIEGFAIYYYWFSSNTMTNNNIIMEKVINNFFNDKIDLKSKKVFFIWANESWTNNNAFGSNTTGEIKNEYNCDNFQNNANDLINYFKHENYLKINNKPVFFVYHNYLIEDIDTFYQILNDLCILNNFDGVHLVLNSFVFKNKKYPNFYINFNYKNFESRFYDENEKHNKLNYKEYTDNPYHLNEKMIQTIVFDFNNRPRLYQPNKLEYSTVCINNSEIDKVTFTNKLIKTYNYDKKNDVENILLINSFNEWGENMAFEPSKKYGYYNMNLLFNCLTK